MSLAENVGGASNILGTVVEKVGNPIPSGHFLIPFSREIVTPNGANSVFLPELAAYETVKKIIATEGNRINRFKMRNPSHQWVDVYVDLYTLYNDAVADGGNPFKNGGLPEQLIGLDFYIYNALSPFSSTRYLYDLVFTRSSINHASDSVDNYSWGMVSAPKKLMTTSHFFVRQIR